MANSIPTEYRGIQFRSRLEATWAAFFDLMGWYWEYEPIDFAGYIPDFLLQMPGPIFVEVKPETDYDDLEQHHDKARKAGVGGLLVLGAFPFGNTIGNACEDYAMVDAVNRGELVEAYGHPVVLGPRCSCAEFGSPSILWESADTCVCVACPWEGQEYAKERPDPREAWVRAKNITQWRGRKR